MPRRGSRRGEGLEKRYGITLAEYDAMVAVRGGRCDICGEVADSGHGSCRNVDHDHLTDEVRGLLCHHCNTGLGRFKDDPLRLAAAIRYLAR